MQVKEQDEPNIYNEPNTYDEPYIITKKRTVRRIYPWRILAVLCFVCLAVMGGVFWFSRTSGTITVKARVYRMVTVGSFSDLGQAGEKASAAAAKGGAGYVYGQKNYAVAMACYASASDADTVCERLRANGEDAAVTELAASRLSIARPKKKANALATLLHKPAALFDALYDISIRADSGDLPSAAVLYAVRKMQNDASAYAQDAAALSCAAGDYLTALFLRLGDIFAAVESKSDNVPSAVKYAQCAMAAEICASTNAFAASAKK